MSLCSRILSSFVVSDGDGRPRLEVKAVGLGVREQIEFTGYASEQEKPITTVWPMPS